MFDRVLDASLKLKVLRFWLLQILDKIKSHIKTSQLIYHNYSTNWYLYIIERGLHNIFWDITE